MNCEICDSEIEGTHFALSALDGTGRTLKTCESCAAGPDVRLSHAGIEVVVDRDDDLRADRERFFYAIESACCGLEDFGWRLQGIRLSIGSDQANEPLDLE